MSAADRGVLVITRNPPAERPIEVPTDVPWDSTSRHIAALLSNGVTLKVTLTGWDRVEYIYEWLSPENDPSPIGEGRPPTMTR